MESGALIESNSRHILGMRVDATTYARASDTVCRWAEEGRQAYVCVASVHMVMEAWDDSDFQQIVNAADLVTSDGMPLVWGLRRLGIPEAERVYGPTLTEVLCGRAAELGVSVGFYGGTQETLAPMQANLKRRFPDLKIAYAYSPPFRALTPDEDQQVVDEILASGAKVIFVGIGCPKQERWMNAHRARLPAVLLGVGAAFDFIAGAKRQAPSWLQAMGLEWLFRMLTEPGRLWKRYMYNNPRFVFHFARQWLFTSSAKSLGDGEPR